MNNVQVINEQEALGKQFRIYGTIDEPLFLAKDVAEWIDYSKTGKGAYDVSRMLSTVDEDEKLIRTIFVSGQNREMWFLTEDGLYEVLMQSRKPIAKQFKKKVKAILKEIRKTGRYESKAKTSAELIFEMARANLENERRMALLEERVHEVESKQETIGKHYYTISGYANLKHFKVDNNTARKLGKQASDFSRDMNYPIGEEYDAKYGTVHAYHTDILKIVFKN